MPAFKFLRTDLDSLANFANKQVITLHKLGGLLYLVKLPPIFSSFIFDALIFSQVPPILTFFSLNYFRVMASARPWVLLFFLNSNIFPLMLASYWHLFIILFIFPPHSFWSFKLLVFCMLLIFNIPYRTNYFFLLSFLTLLYVYENIILVDR